MYLKVANEARQTPKLKSDKSSKIILAEYPELAASRYLSEDRYIEAARKLDEALKKPGIAKKLQQAYDEINREQQESTKAPVRRRALLTAINNKVKVNPPADLLSSALSTVDPWEDPLDPLGAPDFDAAILLNIYVRLERRLKKELVSLANRIDSMEEPSYSDILHLYQIVTTLKGIYESMYESMGIILKKEADVQTQSIIRNL